MTWAEMLQVLDFCPVFIRFIGSIRVNVRDIRVNEVRVKNFRIKANDQG